MSDNKAMIENDDIDFRLYMRYQCRNIDDALKYAQDAKKYKPILDAVIGEPERIKHGDYKDGIGRNLRDKVSLIDNCLIYIGDRLDYVPTTMEELKIVRNLCFKYPDTSIKITREMVELAKLPNSDIFNLPDLLHK